MRERRESNIELLRLLACIGVIVIHIRPVLINSEEVDQNALVIAAVTATDSVAVFFAITGCFWFLRQNSWIKTMWKFLKSVFIPAAVIALVIMTFNPYIYSHSLRPIMIRPDIAKYIEGFLTRDCYNCWGEACGPYWYIFEFAGMVFLYPLLRAVCNGKHDKTVLFIVLVSIALMVLNDMAVFFQETIHNVNIYHIVPMSAVECLIGYMMYKYREKFQGKWWVTGALIGQVVLVVVRYILQQELFKIDQSNTNFLAYDHCLAPIAVFFLFVVFLNVHIGYCPVINKIASYTFYIYLIHYAVRIKLFKLGVIGELQKKISEYISNPLEGDIVYTIATTFIIFFISLLLAFVIKFLEKVISQMIQRLFVLFSGDDRN